MSRRVYADNKEKGFHNGKLDTTRFLVLVITELSEAVEADRKERHSDKEKFELWTNGYTWEDSPITFDHAFKTHIKGTVEEELADAVIRLLDLAGAIAIEVIIPGFPYSSKTEEELAEVKANYGLIEIIYYTCRTITERMNTGLKINDAIYSICNYCTLYGIDLFWHIEQKLSYNRTREHKHGKSY